uniref:Uncharacterized protein n=1 Tax=Rhizophora mucronata TaxID=61149 RepID=A0A2P2LT52_RHIMU
MHGPSSGYWLHYKALYVWMLVCKMYCSGKLSKGSFFVTLTM